MAVQGKASLGSTNSDRPALEGRGVDSNGVVRFNPREESAMRTATEIGPVSNGGARDIAITQPYTVKVGIEGTAPILFHAWNVEAVQEKARAAKGSKGKKEDNIESYVYRDEAGHICIPGEYFRQAVIHAAKYIQDPRSPRKSAMDLFKAGLLVLPERASLGKATWDFLDQRRVVVQRNGVNRVRPAMHKGWRVDFEVEVILPEYITRDVLGAAINNAGRLVGIGDFRPTYGRFQVVKFE